MKKILFIFFMFIGLLGFGQTEYRLFLTAQVQDTSFLFKASLDKTEQIYICEKTDSTIIFSNLALKMVIYKNETEFYFNNEIVDFYETKYWDCHTHIILEFMDTGSKYFFFKIHSKDKTY
jgi:hypothetical protein